VRLLMGVSRESCRVCGGAPFHRLGCPLLNRITFGVAVFFGAVTLALIVSWLLGGPVGNAALGLLLTAFFGVYSFLSRRRSAIDGQTPER
jgi:hypothetical protein